MSAAEMKAKCLAIAVDAAREHGMDGEIWVARKIADAIAAIPVDMGIPISDEAAVEALRKALRRVRKNIPASAQTAFEIINAALTVTEPPTLPAGEAESPAVAERQP